MSRTQRLGLLPGLCAFLAALTLLSALGDAASFERRADAGGAIEVASGGFVASAALDPAPHVLPAGARESRWTSTAADPRAAATSGALSSRPVAPPLGTGCSSTRSPVRSQDARAPYLSCGYASAPPTAPPSAPVFVSL